ncbi:MAG: hypothetical protein SangKO_018740 [Sandaracinaceae bacterium]
MSDQKDESRGDEHEPPLTVAGVGASAGGLQALQELLAGLPNRLPAALVVVQHLSPDFESKMDELLAAHTDWRIQVAEHEQPLERGVIYLMPPKVEMIVSAGRLLLKDREPDPGVWLPIDTFLRSLAEDVGPRACAVILSGTGSDGSRGCTAVHQAGGLVVSQDPASARFDGMPMSAIDTGHVDLVLGPAQIGEAIARYSERVSRDERPFLVEEQHEGLEGIFEILAKDTGVDFGAYKSSTIGRRLDRRLLMTGARDLDEYLDKLRESPVEREALYRDLLIGVTSFFRDADAFAKLEKNVLPELIENLDEGQPLRVWSAACATGEEAYSIAVAVHEAFRQANRKPRLRLFATDVHRGSLEVASSGVYGEEALADMSKERRDRYFAREGERFRVRDEVRNQIVFAYHNVLRDAPFTRLDLVICRNLLIYFRPQAQRKALALFHFGLKSQGILMLGPSESPGSLAEELTPVHRRWKLYRKRREVRLPPELRSLTRARRKPEPLRSSPDDLLERSRRVLLERYAPASLIVSGDHTLLRSEGGASRYLTHREGAASLQILDMVDGELKYALASSLKRAREHGPGKPVRFEAVPHRSADQEQMLAITAELLDGEVEAFLVTFEERAPAEPVVMDADEQPRDGLARERVESLELELRYAKENLQATVEEMEASNEELQATNEELIASNEELHSANEELQSVNEELYTVNAEHQQKISELQQLTNDVEHLLEATEVHTVFLDSELRIRKFTPKMAETFHLIDRDLGRPIESFSHRLDHPDLGRDLYAARDEGRRIEREVEDGDGHCYLMRVLPYQPREKVEGVVLTLIDISAVRRTEARLELREMELEAILEHSPFAITARDPSGRLRMASREARRLFGIEESDVPTRLERTDRQVLESGEPAVIEEACDVDGASRTFLTSKFVLPGPEGANVGVASISLDITDRKFVEEQQRRAVEQRDRFLAMLSHELRNPLAAIANAAHVVERSDEADFGRAIGVMKRQTQHVRDLLEDLLDVSRLTMDRLEMRKKPVSLQTVVERSLEAVMGAARSRGVKLEGPERVPELRLLADPSRLQQMLTNVLMNGVKFTDRGRAVRLSVEVEGGRARVRIRDEGVGMAPEEAARIFELFYQREQDIDRSMGGLGVGLSLARKIAEAHDGSIRASSEGRDKGTEVEIELPLPANTPDADEDDEPSGIRDAASLKVVVVEDQDDNREMLEMLVQMRGHQTVAVADGESAIDAIVDANPDLALVDIGLPGIDGYEVARRVRGRENGSAHFLVALTGYGRAEDKDKAEAAGFDRHLVKPMSKKELTRLLREAQLRRDRGA